MYKCAYRLGNMQTGVKDRVCLKVWSYLFIPGVLVRQDRLCDLRHLEVIVLP